MTARRPLIFGCGTGRCGTRSLAKLLDIAHETALIPWVPHNYYLEKALKRLESRGGDISPKWINYVDRILPRKGYEDTKFVCIQRDKAGTMASYRTDMFKTPEEWESISGFYDSYYAGAERLQVIYSDSFRVFDMDTVLNTEVGQAEMFEFVGREQPMQLGIVDKTPQERIEWATQQHHSI